MDGMSSALAERLTSAMIAIRPDLAQTRADLKDHSANVMALLVYQMIQNGEFTANEANKLNGILKEYVLQNFDDTIKRASKK